MNPRRLPRLARTPRVVLAFAAVAAAWATVLGLGAGATAEPADPADPAIEQTVDEPADELVEGVTVTDGEIGEGLEAWADEDSVASEG